MIDKKRLEELIEQCATIYSNEYGEIQLKKENDLSLYENGQNNYILYALEPNKKYHNEIFDEDLFETEEEAKWFAEFGCVERTEKLELPTWEEFDKKGYIEFVGKEATKLILEKTLTIDCGREPISYYVLEILMDDYNHTLLFEAEYTKENYTLACRKCKELFLGEKK